MKSSIKVNKHILEGDSLDDATIVGNPDFIRNPGLTEEWKMSENQDVKSLQKAKEKLNALAHPEKLAVSKL